MNDKLFWQGRMYSVNGETRYTTQKEERCIRSRWWKLYYWVRKLYDRRLYSEEQIQEWASKRADDAGRLSRQLLFTMRENQRLRTGLESILNYEAYGCGCNSVAREALSNKESNNG